MPSRVVLGGGAAAAAAAYYIYQQRLNEAQKVQSTGFFGTKSAPAEGPAQYTGRQIDETAIQAKNKLQDLQDEAGRKLDKEYGKFQQEKATATNWAADKLNESSQQAQEKADALRAKVDPNATKGKLDRFGNEIKQTFSDAKHATEEKLANVKDRVSSEVNEKKGWFSSTPNDESLAEKAQGSLRGWSETAEQNADAYYNSIHNKAEEAKSSLFSWGSSLKGQSEETLNKARSEAQKLVDDAQKKYQDTKPSLFNRDPEAKRLHEEAEKQLDAAKSQLNSASDKLEQWKQQAKEALGGGKANAGFYDWLRGYNIAPEKESALAERTSRSLRGWGESAELFARDEADEARRRLDPVADKSRVTRKQLGDEVESTIDSWKKWANKKYDSTAQGAQDYYNDTQESLKDAKKEAAATKNSWFSWGSKKSTEVQESSKRNLEEAQRRADEAATNLKKWSSETSKEISSKFWSNADEAISQTKKGVDIASDQTKKGLNEAQSWVKEQKH